MKKIIAKKDFSSSIGNYVAGDEINTKDINVIKKLNEQGFIEPLEYKDLVLIERKLKEEEEKHEL
jgi:hypothetical protein